MWIGSRGGLYRFDPNTTAWSLIPSVENRTCDPGLLKFLRSDGFAKGRICSILQVGDNQDLTEEFTLDKESDVLITSVGEGTLNWDMVDYGWLENARGDTLFTGGRVVNTFHLSSDIKNRIAFGIMKLPAGK